MTIGDGVDQQKVENLEISHIIKDFGISKLIIHGLFPEFAALINKIPHNVSIAWFVWGFDIYNQDRVRNTLYATETQKLRGKFRKGGLKRTIKNIPFIKKLYYKILGTQDYQNNINIAYKRIKYFCSYIEDDFLFFDKFYNHSSAFFYAPFCTIDQYLGGNQDRRMSSAASNILLGNSNSIENNHVDVLEKLKGREGGAKIYIPLSYGNDLEYRNFVIQYGKEKYGEKVVALTDFMAISDYLNLISGCSIAIFYHFRQQAMGNIIALLYMGMRVYLSNNNPAYRYCKRIGLNVFDFDNDYILYGTAVLEEVLADENREILRKNFSKEIVVYHLGKLVESI
ncbi:TDP-N-acetylfucosamine:lipid II N-acetylfucosaminyltransferase [Sphingobacterium sp. WOUb80]|uniref:TDP-N-acetylfucosamine:lipid II N-acetylfucosaminyltransferase n=1 Tax=Sphingobacterium sp. WOUb80 TaxID=3234028 RepID=UPI003CF280FA